MKRRSDSARAAITRQAAAHVALPVLGARLAQQQRLEAAGDRLDRRERVVELVADHADQALPGLALLVAQRAAHVGEHEQLHRLAALAEAAAPHVEAAGGPRERRLDDARRLARRGTRASPSASAPESDQPLGRVRRAAARPRGSRAAASDAASNANTATSISSITLRSSARRLERAQPLLAQRLRERVHLDERLRRARRRGARRARGTRSPPRAARRAGSRASAAAAPPLRARRRRRRASEHDQRPPSVQRVRGWRSLRREQDSRRARAPAAPPRARAAGRAGRAAGVAAAAGDSVELRRARARTAAAGGRARCATGRAPRPRG